MTEMLKTLSTSLAPTTPPHRLIAANVPLAWWQRKTLRQRKTRRKRRRRRRSHCPPWLVFPSVLLAVDFALDYHRRRLIHCCLSQVQYCFCYLSFDNQRRWISTQVWCIVKALLHVDLPTGVFICLPPLGSGVCFLFAPKAPVLSN